MRIIQIHSQSVLFEHARKRLENVFFNNAEEAVQTIQQEFPNHLVFKLGNIIEVANKDATVKVASFQEHPKDPFPL